MGPKFISEPSRVLYDHNSHAGKLSLECIASAHPDPTYEWYKIKEGKLHQIDPAVVT